MDIFDKCYKFTIAREAMAAGYYPFFYALSNNEGTEAIYQGRRLIMCGSNNYLGLTTDPRVRQAAIDAVKTYGTSCTGSRFANGTLELHEQLERQLAEFVGKQAALVFTTGMQVNLGTISALVGRGDYVVMDKEDHASIVDGARLSWGETKRFRHNNLRDFERAGVRQSASDIITCATSSVCCPACQRSAGGWWLWMGYTAWGATWHRCRR
jgi:8-amino-7-oxononanoate synthase